MKDRLTFYELISGGEAARSGSFHLLRGVFRDVSFILLGQASNCYLVIKCCAKNRYFDTVSVDITDLARPSVTADVMKNAHLFIMKRNSYTD